MQTAAPVTPDIISTLSIAAPFVTVRAAAVNATLSGVDLVLEAGATHVSCARSCAVLLLCTMTETRQVAISNIVFEDSLVVDRTIGSRTIGSTVTLDSCQFLHGVTPSCEEGCRRRPAVKFVTDTNLELSVVNCRFNGISATAPSVAPS